MSQHKKKFSCDFETTTDIEDCRVWATGIYDIDELKFSYGNNINFLFDFMLKNLNSILYFHNLKFDGEFIISELFNRGFKHVINREHLVEKCFTTLISSMGQFYSIKICFGYKKEIEILDSLKILPFSVAVIAKAFDLPIRKGSIDYHKHREIGYKLDEEEIDYLNNDVEIVARALSTLFDANLTKMTQGSNALFDFKNTIGVKNFKNWFPTPQYDADIRQSYKGGFTYCNPKYQGQDIGEGVVLDVNSLYPSVMMYERMPYGEGLYFDGEYTMDEKYDLYVQHFSCSFEIKDGFIPTIQIKNNSMSFMPTEYLTSSNDEIIELCLTSVDLKLFKEHYNLSDVTYTHGWKFRSTNGVFKEYIEKWMEVKIQATIDKNYGMRTLAKLMLNALYGKFALSPIVKSKIPYLNEEGIVKYKTGDEEYRDPLYIPVGTFVTAYARYKTITSAQKCFDRFLYADTDSLHLMGTEIPDYLKISDTKLGAWKHESTFSKARFLRQKSYIEEIDGELHVTCSGMPNQCHKNVNWDNFKLGTIFPGKFQMVHVKGGIVLKDIDFTIRG